MMYPQLLKQVQSVVPAASDMTCPPAADDPQSHSICMPCPACPACPAPAPAPAPALHPLPSRRPVPFFFFLCKLHCDPAPGIPSTVPCSQLARSSLYAGMDLMYVWHSARSACSARIAPIARLKMLRSTAQPAERPWCMQKSRVARRKIYVSACVCMCVCIANWLAVVVLDRGCHGCPAVCKCGTAQRSRGSMVWYSYGMMGWYGRLVLWVYDVMIYCYNT
ncbi:hypothetical protein EDC01DRAFT_92466 [Geopyxis carbonaria]|nr:hypothetical protein EDC01DRAFT_92466 [Geopyxis carbonaria]